MTNQFRVGKNYAFQQRHQANLGKPLFYFLANGRANVRDGYFLDNNETILIVESKSRVAYWHPFIGAGMTVAGKKVLHNATGRLMFFPATEVNRFRRFFKQV